MSVASRTQDLRVDPPAIIANRQPQLLVRVFQLEFDVVRLRVTESVGQRFAADTIDLVADQGVQRSTSAFDGDAKIDRLRNP